MLRRVIGCAFRRSGPLALLLGAALWVPSAAVASDPDPCALVNCDDGDPCTIDDCENGVCTWVPAPAGTPCDDGDTCSPNDACTAEGTCAPTGAVDDGTDCDDGEVCTFGETCIRGVCTAIRKAWIADGTACFTDVLNYCTSSGFCVQGHCEIHPPEDGTVCTDGDICTEGDHCVDGACVGTPIWCGTQGPSGATQYDVPSSNLPEPPGIIKPKNAPAWEIEPEDPFGYEDPEPVHGVCKDGRGWSFNDGTLQGWIPNPRGSFVHPVFGNNVDIDRIMPTGYTNSGIGNPKDAVGGDYWRFSRNINQKGLWWIGSGDSRWPRTELPGKTRPDTNAGTLTSPVFEIDAPYISFYIGGSKLTGARVELLVEVPKRGLHPEKVLAKKAEGIGTVEFPPNWQYLPSPTAEPGWVVVRTSANTPFEGNDNAEYMQRRVVWNVSAFKTSYARLRVVDVPTPAGSQEGHINVDDFRCLAQAPEGTQWLYVKGQYRKKSAIGHVIEPVPLWGFTDSHAHVLSNLAFGGHFIWGDPADDLATVYDCATPLMAIEDKHGHIVRNPEDMPDSTQPCTVDGGILAAVAAQAALVCDALALIPPPWLGLALFGACNTLLIEATNSVLNQPILTAYSLHGSKSATGGGIQASLWWDTILGKIVGATGAKFGFDKHVPGVIEVLDFDQPQGTHSKHGGSIHQNFQKDMIQRAWQGGLRLIGLDTINGRLMQGLLDGKTDYSDWQAIWDMVEGTKRLVAGPNDPDYPMGPLHDIAAIAYSPKQARQIIAQNKIAIVLGTEVGELGKKRNAADTPEQQVKDLYEIGIRKITAIHGEDNPLGGAGIFNDIYPIANHFNNVTLDENGEMDGMWNPAIPDQALLMSPLFPIPFGFGLAGGWVPFSKLEAPLDPSAWNLENSGWFRVAETVPTDWIGGYDQIGFRLGFESAKPLAKFINNGEWARIDEYGSPLFKDTGQLKQLMRTESMGWLMNEDFSDACTFNQAMVPMEIGPKNEFKMTWPQSVVDNYAAAKHGHFNAVGLRPDGDEFIWEMMAHGMVLDLDHFSQASRVDTFQLTDTFGQLVVYMDEQNNGTPKPAYIPGYPTFGVHVDVRGMSRHGPAPMIAEMMDSLGWGVETDRTLEEIERVRKDGGALSPGANAGVFDSGGLTNEVANDCDYSSKAAAQKYLTIVKLLKGKGVTMSADMGGPVKHAVPRYGSEACYLRTGPEEDGAFDGKPTTPTGTMQWPRDWTSAMVAKGCAVNGERPPEEWSEECASTQSVFGQYYEGTGVEYWDYQDRSKQVPDESDGLPNDAGIKYVLARAANEKRDDNAPRPQRHEWVAVGNARQMEPMKKMVPTVHGSWDINIDGLQHAGLYPDYIQDLRNVGVLWENLTPMFNGAEDYIRMWEKQCRMANIYREATDLDPIECD
jgi:microsomal dipeptidase-like Zn-dependent dipeptidase